MAILLLISSLVSVSWISLLDVRRFCHLDCFLCVKWIIHSISAIIAAALLSLAILADRWEVTYRWIDLLDLLISYWWLPARLQSWEIPLMPTSRRISLLLLHLGKLISAQMWCISFCHITHIAYILIKTCSHPHLLQAKWRNPFHQRESIIVVVACLLELLALWLIRMTNLR